ncbi:Dynactin subunit 1 [Eumeta japonica]|uniref:Dynactin subunit 1 n=1 Tax=Eumeta variegata TaxID=151549 RepID=A0A4C1VCA3_EUMVA|nr:Dynactin subunit 1 [Eumeta japonica]
MSDKPLTLGQRVKVVAKDVKGTVAYVGYPTFATGKWIGVILDEPKGKNNGTIRGHAYFTCEENYGVFVRQTQIQLLDAEDNPMETSMTMSSSDKSSKTRLNSGNSTVNNSTLVEFLIMYEVVYTVTGYLYTPRCGTTKPRLWFTLNRLTLRSSRTSLAGSRQSLISYPSPTAEERASSPDLTAKRASFVETGFVETLTPQYTPGQSITSPPAPSEDKLANLHAQQEITQLKSEVEDLKEKLETLRIKRAEDREKLRELERVRLQLEQANEFKTKIMESQAQLQRDLQRAKQEMRDVQEALEAHNEETAELQEAAEMAALDKEMAEERAEALQLELESCREKLEEATLDLQLMRAEMEAGGNTPHPYAADGGGCGYETRQLQQQNARLRETLVRLRDLSAHDKHMMQKIQKDLEQSKSEIAELSRTKEKLSQRVDELEGQVADLREQVDAALGAEEMVEQLAEKKMALEDQVEQLKQDVSDLEALQEVHEQLVESNRDLEMDLREELEMAHAATREAIREREAAMETILDRDTTIVKFRELVQRLTEQFNELRSQLASKQGSPAPSSEQESTPEPVRGSPAVELGSLVHASRASTRSIDLQLRALELSQARERADMLAACLPDHFTTPGGDHDAVLMILLLQRLNTKADIILGQIRERFGAVNLWDRETVTKTHTAVQYSFRCQLEYQLNMLQSIVCMWSTALELCTPETLLRAAGALPDALTQERALDGALQLLKCNELDEKFNSEGIERCWTYLSAMWSALNLGTVEGAADAREPLVRVCCALDSLARALHADASALTQILVVGDRQQDVGLLNEHIRGAADALQAQLKGVRRRVPPGLRLRAAGLDMQLVERLRGETASALWLAARACSLTCRAACAAAETGGERGEGALLPHTALLQLWAVAVDKVYQQWTMGVRKKISHRQVLRAVKRAYLKLTLHLIYCLLDIIIIGYCESCQIAGSPDARPPRAAAIGTVQRFLSLSTRSMLHLKMPRNFPDPVQSN